jgi:hypothetical protein
MFTASINRAISLIITLMMEVVIVSEISVKFYGTKPRSISEGLSLDFRGWSSMYDFGLPSKIEVR